MIVSPMKKLNLRDVLQYVEDNISFFHSKRIDSLNTLKLDKVLKRKNPYLFKAKCVLTSEGIVKSLVDAHISSHEETIFGDWLENLAIFINEKVFCGRKSGIKGVDLEFDSDGKRYIVAIKSGPNWGNSSQIEKMRSDFKSASKILRTSNSNINVVAINGCCYGMEKNPDKGDYFKYCGQKFWQLISNESTLFTEIIEPIGHKAKEQNDSFVESYSKMINRFTVEFASSYCRNSGEINWNSLVKFNSGHS